ncbi:MAG: J domain-containing protein, partial [Acetobacteraceae bacterium]
MSRGHGKVERRIGKLFAATKDLALSIGDVASYAFELTDGVEPNRKQRLSATRAAHGLLRRAAALAEATEATFDRAIAETTAKLGRPPGGRGRSRDWIFGVGSRFVAMDEAFHEAVQSAPGWPAYQQASKAWKREYDRLNGALLGRNRGWRATETKDRRLWFHPADYPVRMWAVGIEPQGVVWADTEITGVDNTYVRVRYRGEPARLNREDLARSWTIYRNVFFSSSRSGYAARSFDQMWQQKYWRAGSSGAPPILQMLLADAIKLLGVPADFTREDIISAFRRKALRCHP